MEIKDTKDIIYDNYKIHHVRLGKDIRPKKHDTKKWIAVDDIKRKLTKIYEDCNDCRVQEIQRKIGDFLREVDKQQTKEE